MKVLYLNEKNREHLEYLRDNTHDDIEIFMIPPEEEEEYIEKAGEVDVLIGAWVPKKFFENAGNLKYFIVPFAGIPQKDRKTLEDFPDITVINSHFNASIVAEHTWAIILATAKRLCPIHERMKKGDWTPRYDHWWGTMLKDKELLIVGYGKVGREIGKIGKAFGMTVRGIKKSPGKAEGIDHLGTNDELCALLKTADMIVVTLPHTDETEDYVGEIEFDAMKDGVYLFNVGRGPVVNEEAFYNALKSGKIAGAGIDTWWIYPPDEESRGCTYPSKYPIHQFDNVLFSPHRGSHVRERELIRMDDLADILNSLAGGEEINVVNLERGY
ncbi:MAG: 2-hydroxyacid dehydrogenase [Thermoplasmata archaeon]